MMRLSDHYGAVEHNQLSFIEMLIERKANINAVTHEGITPLHIASQRG
jgi:ankyrin repeat protein